MPVLLGDSRLGGHRLNTAFRDFAVRDEWKRVRENLCALETPGGTFNFLFLAQSCRYDPTDDLTTALMNQPDLQEDPEVLQSMVVMVSAADSDHTLAPPGRKQPDNRAHMACTAGPHMCPAQDTARVITRTAVDTAPHLLPGLRLTISPDEVAWNPSPWTRCPTQLPVSSAVVPHFGSPASDRPRPVGDHA